MTEMSDRSSVAPNGRDASAVDLSSNNRFKMVNENGTAVKFQEGLKIRNVGMPVSAQSKIDRS